jgi:hypothetical protein
MPEELCGQSACRACYSPAGEPDQSLIRSPQLVFIPVDIAQRSFGRISL